MGSRDYDTVGLVPRLRWSVEHCYGVEKGGVAKLSGALLKTTRNTS